MLVCWASLCYAPIYTSKATEYKYRNARLFYLNELTWMQSNLLFFYGFLIIHQCLSLNQNYLPTFHLRLTSMAYLHFLVNQIYAFEKKSMLRDSALQQIKLE